MRVKEIIRGNETWMPNKEYNKVIPDVSIILPTFRRAQSGYFENAVMSVINQTYQKWELIIIDDASTDGTADLIKKFIEIDSRINCIRHKKNIGLPAVSEYEGYMRSRGQYIAFIFDDNIWEKEYLFKTIIMMERKKVKASYGIARGYSDLKRKEYVELGRAGQMGLADLMRHNFIANGAVILHRDVIEDIGLYDPHLTLTRLCDWDLWRRIYKKYEILQTNIPATNEMGVCLGDSLGNSYAMNMWCSLERMNERRDEMLRPSVYEALDIVETNGNNTDYYRDTLKELSNQFKNKAWYSGDDILRKKIETGRKRKRVIVVHDGMTASVTLYMERLFNNCDEYIVRYCQGSVNKCDLILADVVVAVRSVLLNEPLTELCNTLQIPIYYFVDDNFIELAKEFSNDTDIVRMGYSTNRMVLKKYTAVVVSSPELKRYFEDNLLHNKILLLEPIIREDEINKKCNLHQEELRIGFLGGKWREKAFIQWVVPALRRLANNINLTLYLPVENEEDQMDKYRKKYADLLGDILKVEFIEKTLSLDVVLLRMMEKNIDVLIHCGDSNVNNKFKTENALINAIQVGAVLIVSDELPYKESMAAGKGIIIAKNDVEDWYNKLKSLQDINFRKEIFESARRYCMEKYLDKEAAKEFTKELDQIDVLNYYTYLKRSESLLQISGVADISSSEQRSFRNLRLGLATLIKNKIAYDFISTVNEIREVKVLFGSYELLCGGRIKVCIKQKRKVLFEKWFPISYFIREDWTVIEVGKIPDMYNQRLTIEFQCEYDDGSALVGFFEDLNKRTFWYKVFNKLGHHINGLNAIVIECR